MKRILALVLLLSLVLAALAALPIAAAEPRLATDKTTYAPGEPILVTATGEGKDWVGLYRAADSYDPSAGGQVSIYWYYVAADGNASGDTVNLYEADYNNFASRPEFASGLPAGEYKVVLLANDGYEVIESVAITVAEEESAGPLPAPTHASYKSAEAGVGRADGTLTVRHDTATPDAYVIRWGDSRGALADYTDLATVPATAGETTYTLTPHTLIPVGADRLLVYARQGSTLSSDPAIALLPSRAGEYDLGTPVLEFPVMSDIHINEGDSHIHNRHFAAALADILRVAPDSVGIFINGDIADHGVSAEYTAFNRLLHEAGADLPAVYCAIGNHDLGAGGTDAEKLAAFLAGTGNDSETVYFEREIRGVRFLFLGSEVTGTQATLSRAQLDWLETALEEPSDAPVFLFLHQGIKDTVAGTMAYQGWHGVNQEAALRRILADHPEVILFSGHSHWTLESESSLKVADGRLPTILNTASCGYLWDDDANKTNIGIEGSQGYYVSLYPDRVVFRGRDFASGKWVSSAQFVIDRPAGHAAPETPPPETLPAPLPPATETPAPGTTPQLWTPPADTDLGCASALTVGATAVLAALAAAVALRKKES